MHASTKQLLNLRDGELIAADVQQHVDDCEQCQREIHTLRSVQQALRQFPNASSSEGSFNLNWGQVQRGIQVRKTQARRQRRLGHWAVAASVAVIIIVTLPFLKDVSKQSDDTQVADASVSSHNPSLQDFSSQQLQAQLLQRNWELESALRELPKPPKIMRGGTAYAIASFEDQIALVDFELSYSDELGLDESRSVSLLQNRADLLGSLYQVRYTQAMAGLVNY
jgi:hypothetical protein